MQPFRASNLSQTTRIAHGFFGRQGGVSEGIYSSLNCGPGSHDRPGAVAENRRRAKDALLSAGHGDLVTLYQIHGAGAIRVENAWPDETRPQADGMVTNKRGIALGILTADCAPILFSDSLAGVVGAAHAGWKGALANVMDSVVIEMERLGAKRARIVAAIGPCISQASYEVGQDLRDRFTAADSRHARFFTPGEGTHHQFDLAGFVESQLHASGLTNVEALDCCTYRQAETFFSYRRTTHRKESDYGRQLSAIALI